MTAKVTICIPTRNRSHFVREAIQSALNQTISDFEVLVSDNASTDDTGETIASFRDPRIHYYRHPANIGLAANHQFVTTLAQTEYVAILPDDDLLLPDHLETALKALGTYSQAAYYSSAIERFGHCRTGTWYPAAITDTHTPIIYLPPERAVDFLGIENPGFMNSLVCRKDRLKSTLFWGKAGFVHADVLIMTQLMVQGGCVYANRPTVRYRCHDTNISRPLNGGKHSAQRLHYMLRQAVRYLAQMLLDKSICSPADIVAHGLRVRPEYAARLVLSLGSFYSSPSLRQVARRILLERTDIDRVSVACRVARRTVFSVIPLAEQVALMRHGWHP
jgi:glycosyltransferase involved in cell wall biosynthesis